MRIPVGRGFAGRVAAERGPVQITDVDHADILNPLLREKGLQSLLGVPLLTEERLIGVLHVGALTEPHVLARRDRPAAAGGGPGRAGHRRPPVRAPARSGRGDAAQPLPAPAARVPGRVAGGPLLARCGRAAGRRLVRRLPAAHGLAGPGHGRRGGAGLPGGGPDGTAAQRAARLRVRRQRALGADDQAQRCCCGASIRAAAPPCSTWSSTPRPDRCGWPPRATCRRCCAGTARPPSWSSRRAVPLGVIANPVYDDMVLEAHPPMELVLYTDGLMERAGRGAGGRLRAAPRGRVAGLVGSRASWPTGWWTRSSPRARRTTTPP